MEYHWFRWILEWNHQLKKNRGVLEKQGLLSTHHRFDAEYSNIRRRMFDSGLSNPNQSLWIFVKPECRFRESNIRFAVHWFPMSINSYKWNNWPSLLLYIQVGFCSCPTRPTSKSSHLLIKIQPVHFVKISSNQTSSIPSTYRTHMRAITRT